MGYVYMGYPVYTTRKVIVCPSRYYLNRLKARKHLDREEANQCTAALDVRAL